MAEKSSSTMLPPRQPFPLTQSPLKHVSGECLGFHPLAFSPSSQPRVTKARKRATWRAPAQSRGRGANALPPPLLRLPACARRKTVAFATALHDESGPAPRRARPTAPRYAAPKIISYFSTQLSKDRPYSAYFSHSFSTVPSAYISLSVAVTFSAVAVSPFLKPIA